MPTNLMLVDSQFPRLDQGENTQESITKLQNYLYMLVEQLRYSLHNLDLSNLNQAAWDDMKMEISKPIYVALENSTGGSAELEATVAGLKTTVEQQGQSISQFQQTASSLSASVTDLQTGMSATLRLDADGFVIQGDNPKDRVTIQGGQLAAGTVSAARLVSEEVSLIAGYDEDGFWKATVGSIKITDADSADYAVDIRSSYAIRIGGTIGYTYISGGIGGDNGSDKTFIALASDTYDIVCKGNFSPNADAAYNSGTANNRWNTVYSANGVKTTSDRREKHDIEPLPEKYIDLFDRLDVYRYRMNGDPTELFHVGFVAQDVESSMGESGIDVMEFGGLSKEKAHDGNDIYMLRYDEFIGILAAKIKQLEAKVEALEGKI